MAKESFTFVPGRLKTNLRNFDNDINALVSAVFDYRGDRAVAWMKTNAKWTDRTANARATLQATGEFHPDYWILHLFGGMPYQIWLEIRFAGRYAIITPAVRVQSRALMEQLKGLLIRLGKL